MRTIETNVYKFDELSDAAKERARDWFREASAGDTPDCALDDAVTIAALMGIEIERRHWTNSHGFKGSSPEISYCAGHVQGDGAAFTGRYRYRKGAVKAVREYAPQDAELRRIAEALQDVQKRNFYQLTARMSEGRRGLWTTAEVERYDGAAMTDGAEDEISELMRDFAAWIYDQLIAEVDYQSSDEAVDESIEANEYEFTEQGNRARA